MTLSIGEDSRDPFSAQAQDRQRAHPRRHAECGQACPGPGDGQLLYVGQDDRGIELLIIAVPDNRDPGGLAVIHAMPTGLGKREG